MVKHNRILKLIFVVKEPCKVFYFIIYVWSA